MTEESRSKLFMDFGKMEENANLNRNGVGLGLSICKSLIETMGGSVEVQSEVGKGTTFTIPLRTTTTVPASAKDCWQHFLPRMPPRVANENLEVMQVLEEQRNNPGVEMHFSEIGEEKPTLLIANDCFFILECLADLLEPIFQVYKADNGFEAFKLVRGKSRHFFDAIVLDLEMPILNGYMTCEKVCEYVFETGIDSVVSVSETPLSARKSPRSQRDELMSN